MTSAVKAVEQAGIDFLLHEYQNRQQHGYGHEAATSLGVAVTRVFKTLLTKIDNKSLVVALVPVSHELNLRTMAKLLGGKKAEMANPAEARKSTGYVLGGISPLGQKRVLETVIDNTAQQHCTIFISAGRRGLEIELAPADLIHLCNAKLGAISR